MSHSLSPSPFCRARRAAFAAQTLKHLFFVSQTVNTDLKINKLLNVLFSNTVGFGALKKNNKTNIPWAWQARNTVVWPRPWNVLAGALGLLRSGRFLPGSLGKAWPRTHVWAYLHGHLHVDALEWRKNSLYLPCVMDLQQGASFLWVLWAPSEVLEEHAHALESSLTFRRFQRSL